MNFTRWMVTTLCKFGLEVMCKIDAHELKKIPQSGPLILYANHTGTVEAPIILTQLAPREKVTGFGKIEIWEHWFLRWIFNTWEIIPIRRGEVDMEALRKGLNVLGQGYILGLAPEGTRSKDGRLLHAHAGAVMIALKSGAPLQVIAHWGGEHFGSNVKKFKRTDFTVRVGPRFYLDDHGEKITKEVRQQMVDEMMYQLAKLLPEEYRGVYSDMEKATTRYLRFVD